jgi:hypothetical protein
MTMTFVSCCGAITFDLKVMTFVTMVRSKSLEITSKSQKALAKSWLKSLHQSEKWKKQKNGDRNGIFCRNYIIGKPKKEGLIFVK